MVIEYPFPQRSPEWFAVKLGKCSGSIMPKLMKTERAKADWTATQLDIVYELASQIATGERQETFQSKAMEWGTVTEDAARAFFSERTESEVRACGYFENTGYDLAGVSPDGVFPLDDIGIKIATLEIKCPNSKTHIKYLANPEALWLEYKWQVVMENVITEAEASFICSFDPRFKEDHKKMVIYPCPITDNDRLLLSLRLSEAREKIKEVLR